LTLIKLLWDPLKCTVQKLISARRKQGIVTGKCGFGTVQSDVTLLNDVQNFSILRWRSSFKGGRYDGKESRQAAFRLNKLGLNLVLPHVGTQLPSLVWPMAKSID
jgi:hypothetical protein